MFFISCSWIGLSLPLINWTKEKIIQCTVAPISVSCGISAWFIAPWTPTSLALPSQGPVWAPKLNHFQLWGRRENTLFRLDELRNVWLSRARWKPDSFSTMTLDVPALGNILVLITLDCKGLYFGIAMAASPGCDVKVAKVTARPSVMCSDIHIGGSNKSSKENNFWDWTFKYIWMIICSFLFADT